MNQDKNNDITYRLKEGFRDGIPISLGYFAVSIALGINCRSAGMDALQSGVMSLFMLASAGEFAAVTLISSGAGALEMIVTTIVVNMRYLLMGAALSQKVDPDSKLGHRFGMAYCITDELFGICSAKEGCVSPWYAYGAASIAAVGWTAGTVLGVVIGNVLPFFIVDALSVSLYGMFLAVIIPAAKASRFIAGIVAVSMAASFAMEKIPALSRISSGFRIIILTIVIASAAAVLRPVDDMPGSPSESSEKEAAS